MNECLQILADITGRSGANTRPMVQEREPFNFFVNHICQFFSEFNFDTPHAPMTPKLTAIQYLPESDQGERGGTASLD